MNSPPDREAGKKPVKGKLRRFQSLAYLKRLKRARTRARKRSKKTPYAPKKPVIQNDEAESHLRAVAGTTGNHLKLLRALASLLVKQSLGDVHER